MPIVNSDILFKLSVPGASAGNTTAQPNVNNSLGGFLSTTQITNMTLNNLFDNVTGAENAASQSDYRCFFVHNNNATLTLQAAVLWLSAEVPGGANSYIGVDPAAASAIGSSTSQAAVIANDTTAPAGVTFSNPTTKLAGIAIGDIPPGTCRGIWVKRIATNSVALGGDGCSLRVEGDTAA